MADEETAMRRYLRSGGATEDEIDDFIDWCYVICLGGAGHATERRWRFCCYRLWANLMRHRRTPHPRNGRFDFDETLKQYIRTISPGDVLDAAPPAEAIVASSTEFVKFVVRHLDDAL